MSYWDTVTILKNLFAIKQLHQGMWIIGLYSKFLQPFVTGFPESIRILISAAKVRHMCPHTYTPYHEHILREMNVKLRALLTSTLDRYMWSP